MLNGFDDELVVTGHIEDGSAGSGVGQLNQWFITQRVLQAKEERANMVTCLDLLYKSKAVMFGFGSGKNAGVSSYGQEAIRKVKCCQKYCILKTICHMQKRGSKKKMAAPLLFSEKGLHHMGMKRE